MPIICILSIEKTNSNLTQKLPKTLPIVLGITGASGFIYGLGLLKFFIDSEIPVDLTISEHALDVSAVEVGLGLKGKNSQESLNKILDFIYSKDFLLSKIGAKDIDKEKAKSLVTIWDQKNIAASIASGSYKTQGMIVAPCSMGSIGSIAAGTSNNLLTRAADVCIKEQRKLVLLARETPFSPIHLKNMLYLSELGVVILPANPGFYHQPQSQEDLINFVIGKTLDSFGLDNSLFKRWLQA